MSGAARRAATEASPALATLTNGRPSPSRPSSNAVVLVPLAASAGRLERVERQPGGAHEVVRGPARDHAERDAEAPGELGDRGDRPVAAGHDEPLGRGRGRALELLGLAAEHGHVGVHGPDQRLGVEPAAGGPVGDQRHAHRPSLEGEPG